MAVSSLAFVLVIVRGRSKRIELQLACKLTAIACRDTLGILFPQLRWRKATNHLHQNTVAGRMRFAFTSRVKTGLTPTWQNLHTLLHKPLLRLLQLWALIEKLLYRLSKIPISNAMVCPRRLSLSAPALRTCQQAIQPRQWPCTLQIIKSSWKSAESLLSKG